jgi:DNA-binding response OmpR family regulator
MRAREGKNRIRIGVVEDDSLVSGMLLESLERFGYMPFIFNDGWSFLEALNGNYQTIETKPFDIVLLDILLPGTISGIEVLQYLSLTRPELPLIILSALNKDDLKNIQEQYPKSKILQKPFRLSDLQASIEA